MKNGAGVATSIADGIILFKMISHMPTPVGKPCQEYTGRS